SSSTSRLRLEPCLRLSVIRVLRNVATRRPFLAKRGILLSNQQPKSRVIKPVLQRDKRKHFPRLREFSIRVVLPLIAELDNRTHIKPVRLYAQPPVLIRLVF